MRSFQRLKYFFRRTWESVVENPFLNLVTVGILAATLFIVAGFLQLRQSLDTVFTRWGRGVRVVAYLKPDLDAQPRNLLIRKIQQRDEVAEVRFIDKNQALVRFKSVLGDNRTLIADFTQNNPLPESLEVDVKDAARSRDTLSALAQWLSGQHEVTDVVYGREWLDRFQATLELFNILGFVLGALLFLAALFIVSNTIKITLFARKEELNIMQLVGATPGFIRVPFVLEGSLQGLIAALAAVGGLYLLYGILMKRLTETFAAPALPFLSGSLVLAIVAGGVILGAGASLISVGRFLKH